MAIRPDIDPKSASPRSGAPKGELEQYGVWVKAEPQDVIEESSAPLSGDLSFDLSDGSTPVAEESFLSAAEEKLLNTFDEEFEASSAGPLPDIEDMPELDESLLEPEAASVDAQQESALDMDIEDIDLEPPAQGSGLEDLSSEFLDAEGPQASEPPAEQGFDDVTSDFVDTKEEPPANVDFDTLDMDLPLEDNSAPAGPEDSAVPLDAGFDDVSAVEQDLSSPLPASPEEPSFEDDFGEEAASPASVAPAAAVSAPPSSDLSNELLRKIAEELSSIRGELVSLKSQIGDVVASVEAAPKKAQEAPAEVESEPSTGGFFDEEEDETIALTGDELDNILNTADFTEEVAESEQPVEILEEPSIEAMGPDLLDESLLPESGDYSAPIPVEPAIEEVRLGQSDVVDSVTASAPEVAAPDIAAIAEEGVMPMTPAPEDTSYLEEPEGLAGAAGLDADAGLEGPGLESEALMSEALASEPIVEAPLVEPDLSTFDLGEDELEVSEELPLAGGERPSEDLVLDIDAGPDYSKPLAAEDLVPEAEFLEPVQEIEETSFGEINLHEEKVEAASRPAPRAASVSSSEPAEVEEIDIFSDADMVGNLGGEEAAAEEIDLSAESLESTSAEPAPAADEELVIAVEEEAGAAPAPAKAPAAKPAAPRPAASEPTEEDDTLKSEIKSVLSYLDKLLDSLPEEKIEEFAHSEYFDTYKKLFEELGLV